MPCFGVLHKWRVAAVQTSQSSADEMRSQVYPCGKRQVVTLRCVRCGDVRTKEVDADAHIDIDPEVQLLR
jgi:hypothetical protein